MRYIRFQYDDQLKYGVVNDGTVFELENSPFLLQKTAYVRELSMDSIDILPPCTPSKYLGVGLNFPETALAMSKEIPKYPITFIKPSSAIIGQNKNIEINNDKHFFEGELAVVIGKTAKDVSIGDALNYVFGHTCTNDITNISQFNSDMLKLKAADTYAPLGPCITTNIDPFKTRIRSWVNGDLKQDGLTSNYIFDIPYIISFFSKYMTLFPGDVIAMGAPPGFCEININDRIKIEIDGIGILENKVVRKSKNK